MCMWMLAMRIVWFGIVIAGILMLVWGWDWDWGVALWRVFEWSGGRSCLNYDFDERLAVRVLESDLLKDWLLVLVLARAALQFAAVRLWLNVVESESEWAMKWMLGSVPADRDSGWWYEWYQKGGWWYMMMICGGESSATHTSANAWLVWVFSC